MAFHEMNSRAEDCERELAAGQVHLLLRGGQPEQLTVAGYTMGLSACERQILYRLLLAADRNPELFLSPEELASHTCPAAIVSGERMIGEEATPEPLDAELGEGGLNATSVRMLIARINEKSRVLCGRRIIEGRTGRGYRISPFS